MNESPDERQKLWEMIKGIKFAMFTTRHSNGHLHARPMTTQNKALEADGTLWFFMSRRSDPVDDFDTEPNVAAVYADPGSDTYVSVSGRAKVVDDLAKKKALWSKLNEAWFPEGPEDPNVALVGIEIVHANYWDVKSSKLVQLLTMAKSVVTGKPPTDMGDSGEIRMR